MGWILVSKHTHNKCACGRDIRAYKMGTGISACASGERRRRGSSSATLTLHIWCAKGTAGMAAPSVEMPPGGIYVEARAVRKSTEGHMVRGQGCGPVCEGQGDRGAERMSVGRHLYGVVTVRSVPLPRLSSPASHRSTTSGSCAMRTRTRRGLWSASGTSGSDTTTSSPLTGMCARAAPACVCVNACSWWRVYAAGAEGCGWLWRGGNPVLALFRVSPSPPPCLCAIPPLPRCVLMCA